MTRRFSSRRRLLKTGFGLAAVGIAGCVDTALDDGTADDNRGFTPAGEDSDELHAGYEMTEVRVASGDETLGTVTAALADTPEKRYTGLSETESLPEDRGMLFVMDEPDDYTFVMREMDFGIDIVYADSDKTITEIHHAPEPGPGEDGEQQEYPGYGEYILEVVYRWTEERGVEVGDRLEFDL